MGHAKRIRKQRMAARRLRAFASALERARVAAFDAAWRIRGLVVRRDVRRER